MSAERERMRYIGFGLRALGTQHSMMGGRSSAVEFQPSKLAVVGSNPIARSSKT